MLLLLLPSVPGAAATAESLSCFVVGTVAASSAFGTGSCFCNAADAEEAVFSLSFVRAVLPP